MSKPANPLFQAISDAELEDRLRLLVSAVAVSEEDRAAWYRSAERYPLEHREPDATKVYPYPKLAGVFLRLAHLTWDKRPPQDE